MLLNRKGNISITNKYRYQVDRISLPYYAHITPTSGINTSIMSKITFD